MTAESQFWSWFAELEAELHGMLEADPAAFTRRVNARLGITHPGIGCQPAGNRGGALWDLYITAHGVIENFDAVDALVASAPELRHFRAVAFMPPAEGVSAGQDVRFRHVMEDDRASVTLFVDGYQDDPADNRVPVAMHNLLTALLGEYAFETKVGAVEVAPLVDSVRSLPSIDQLPAALK